jgi:hypothetical protein
MVFLALLPENVCRLCAKASGLREVRQYHSVVGEAYTDAVVTPPSTTMVWPVMKVDASEAR